jgi:hypothetical protein
MIACIPSFIQTKRFQNTSLEHYGYTVRVRERPQCLHIAVTVMAPVQYNSRLWARMWWRVVGVRLSMQAVKKRLYISAAQVSDWAPSARIGHSIILEPVY